MLRTGCLLILLGIVFPAWAGPNAGGTLVLHWNAAIQYTGEPVYLDGGLIDCAGAVVQAPPAPSVPAPDGERRIWFIYAAFPPGTVPRMKATCFGISFNPLVGSEGLSVSWARREDALIEFPSQGWPYQSGTGTILVFDEAKTGLLEQVYVFAGYATQGEMFRLAKHPSIPTQFADDALPSNLDDVVSLGTLGFGVEGNRPCPGPVYGACCLLAGGCEIRSPLGCRPEGDYLGNSTECTPTLCDQPRRRCIFADGHCENLIEDACHNYGGTWEGGTPYSVCPGACCLPDGGCLSVIPHDCEYFHGTYMGDHVPCDPDPCPPSPVETTTWGQLKSRYR